MLEKLNNKKKKREKKEEDGSEEEGTSDVRIEGLGEAIGGHDGGSQSESEDD